MSVKPGGIKEIVWTGDDGKKVKRRPEVFDADVEPGGDGISFRFAGHGGGPDTASGKETRPMIKATPKAPDARYAAAGKPLTPVTPAQQSRALAETVVNSLVDRLTVEAEKKGGQLTVADLKAMDKEFERKTEALQTVFEKTFEEYVKARERAAWESARQYPFDRLLVKTFSHLFPGEGSVGIEPGEVSRRVLPGVFLAVNMMLGAEVVENYQNRCRRVVDMIKKRDGDDFAWQAVYANPDARNLVMDAVASMAFHFQAPAKRTRWLAELVNQHLGPYDKQREKGVPEFWQLDELGAFNLVAGLFSDIRANLRTDDGMAVLRERYGKANTASIRDVMAELEKAWAGVKRQASPG